MKIETVVVGYGAIGQELVRQIQVNDWNVRYIFKSGGVYTLDSTGKLVFAVKLGQPPQIPFPSESVQVSENSPPELLA